MADTWGLAVIQDRNCRFLHAELVYSQGKKQIRISVQDVLDVRMPDIPLNPSDPVPLVVDIVPGKSPDMYNSIIAECQDLESALALRNAVLWLRGMEDARYHGYNP